MQKEPSIVECVYAAKTDMSKADALISDYLPFIKSQVSKSISRICTENDDEFSIGMIAFHEAIQGYAEERGGFLAYAGMLIKSRLIDFNRREQRHLNQVSLDEEGQEDGQPLHEKIADGKDDYEESATREATRQEIEELASVMKSFRVTFSDVTSNCPKQERTLEACLSAVRYGASNKKLLDEMLRTKKLPMADLVEKTGVPRKTLERHRNYILAMLLIQTNGYEIIRGHLRRTINMKGEVAI